MDVVGSAANGARLTRKQGIVPMLLITVGYLLLSYILIGIRPEQIALLAVVNALYFISSGTRSFIIAFASFVVYWIIFDYMKAFPNYRYAPVHIQSLYDFDKNLFGIHYGNTIVSLNEYFLLKQSAFLDVLAGSFYLTWIPVPLMFGVHLFYTNKRMFFYFAYTFFLVNIIGFIIYYLYPAAPPWYIQEHGNVCLPNTPCGIGGLARFDTHLDVTVFASLYKRSSNVFAAMPSLHCSYPTIVFYYSLKNKMGWGRVLFGIIMLGVWFAAIYTSHHYLTDVIAGVLCASTGIALFAWLASKRPLSRFLDKMVSITS